MVTRGEGKEGQCVRGLIYGGWKGIIIPCDKW
jgi:hypothetical protein